MNQKLSSLCGQNICNNDHSKQELLRVSIVGAANAGKSSLFNCLIDLWASAVSHRYNTTRSNLIGCSTRNNRQVVLVDTPGTSHVKTLKRHKIDPGILDRPSEANFHCDMILCVVDGASKRTCNSLHEILFDSLLRFRNKKLILVFNKIDKIENKCTIFDRISQITGGIIAGKDFTEKKIRFLDKFGTEEIRKYENRLIHTKKCGFPYFERAFPISTLDLSGMNELKDFLFESTVTRSWIFDKNLKVKANEEELLKNFVIENLLDYFPQNLIYRCRIMIEDPILAQDILYYKIKLFVKHFYRRKFLDHRHTHYLHEICLKINRQMENIVQKKVSVNLALLDQECVND